MQVRRQARILHCSPPLTYRGRSFGKGSKHPPQVVPNSRRRRRSRRISGAWSLSIQKARPSSLLVKTESKKAGPIMQVEQPQHFETRFFQGRSVSISRYEDRGRPVRTADSERLASECLADSIGWRREGGVRRPRSRVSKSLRFRAEFWLWWMSRAPLKPSLPGPALRGSTVPHVAGGEASKF